MDEKCIHQTYCCKVTVVPKRYCSGVMGTVVSAAAQLGRPVLTNNGVTCVVWRESVNHVMVCFVVFQQMFAVCFLSLFVSPSFCYAVSICGCILILLFHIATLLLELIRSAVVKDVPLTLFLLRRLRLWMH